MKKCNKLFILKDYNDDICLASPWESDCHEFIAECEYEILTDHGDIHTREHEDLAQYGLENGWQILEVGAMGIYMPDTIEELNKENAQWITR